MGGIRGALQSYWYAIKSLYEELYLLIVLNLIWSVFTFLILAPFLVLWLFVPIPAAAIVLAFLLPTPPAAGMYYVAHMIVHEKGMPSVSMWWEGLRTYWRQSLILFAVGLVGTGLIWFNVAFYASLSGPIFPALTIFSLYVLIVWLTMQVYTLPLLMEQTDKRLRLVYKNTFLTTFGNLGFNLVFVVLLALTIGLSVLLTIPTFLLTMGFVALYASHGLLWILRARGLRPPHDEET
jgi:uncharacterized membrane protein YesL